MTTEPCPLCGRHPQHPMRLEVCGECYQEMTAAGAGALQATGEFHAMTPERVEKMVGATNRPRSMTGTPDLACTWCGKQRGEVKKILSGQSGHICNECVALCSDILESELGPDWR
jgi:ClpX C4-type zinc finger